MNRLHQASKSLDEALENYSRICSDLTKRYQFCNAGDYVFKRLLDNVTHQLQRNEAKLYDIQSRIDRSKGSVLASPQADSLPEEALFRIFYFVLKARPTFPETFRGIGDTRLVEPGSDHLAITQTCSRWRLVTVNSKILWTHIDISPFSPFLPQFLSRAEACARWSGDLALHLRIHDDCEPPLTTSSGVDSRLARIIDSIGSRVSSLQLGIHWMVRPHHLHLIDYCLASCEAKTLTHLEIKTSCESPTLEEFNSEPFHQFFHGNPPWCGSNDEGITFGIPGKQIEELLRHVTVLRINRLYPGWISSAYRGLIELSLTCRNDGEGSGPVPQLFFALVFGSNPGIQVLRFGLKIKSTSNLPTTKLSDLKVLHLETPDIETQRALLRLISPGKQLFRVNIKLRIPEEKLRMHVTFQSHRILSQYERSEESAQHTQDDPPRSSSWNTRGSFRY
ncbi:hypothetical protein RHS02_05556, partial [Rhizoctonia solani]